MLRKARVWFEAIGVIHRIDQFVKPVGSELIADGKRLYSHSMLGELCRRNWERQHEAE